MNDTLAKLTLDDIVWWIVKHSDDKAAMDKINKLSFVYTQKYSDFTEKGGFGE